jgi:hypothetical protein
MPVELGKVRQERARISRPKNDGIYVFWTERYIEYLISVKRVRDNAVPRTKAIH